MEKPRLSPAGPRLALGLAALALAALPRCACQEPGAPAIEVLSPDNDSHLNADPYLVVNFGDVDSTLAVTKIVTVRNVGEAPLEVTNACFVEAAIEDAEDATCMLDNPEPYTLEEDTPLTLEPGDSAEVRVSYTPTFGAPTRVLRIDSNDPSTPKIPLLVVGDVDIIPGSLSGCICEDGVGWVEDATVTLAHEQGTLSATTDEGGCFLFEEVPSGARTVEVAGASYSESIEIDVEARQHNTVGQEECASPAGHIVGCVCDEDAYQWVIGGEVRVETAEEGTLTTTTDADGCFLLEDVPIGPQTVTVTGTQFAVDYDVTVVGSEIVAVPTPETCAPPTGSIQGCPCDESVYQPAPGATILVETDDFGDVTGTVGADGCFLLEGVPFGNHTLTVDDGAGYTQSWNVQVAVGETTEIPGPAVCAPCSYEQTFDPVVTTDPVDILLVIDSSGSMNDENDAVEDNLNAFSQAVAGSGIDYRVVTIGRAEAPPPLGGGPNYLHVETSVYSHNALLEVLGHYDDYDQFLRANSKKHLVAITDDSSQLSATSFTANLNDFDEPGFGDDWVFHSIVGYGNVPQVGCSSAAGIGDDYLELSAATGGYTTKICGADFTAVFDAIFAAVTFEGIPCSYDLDSPPAGSTFDAENVEVTWYKGPGGQQAFPRNDACNGDGWRYDNPSDPTLIELCPSSCAEVDSDNSGYVKLGLGCVFD